MNHRLQISKLLSIAVAVAAAAAWFQPARGQVVSEAFTGTSVSSNWVFTGTGGFTPALTTNLGVDTTGNGWLRLTNTSQNLATSAYYNQAFTSANATVYAKFDFESYGGTGGTTNGADGIVFFLFDGSKTFGVGANGGSLGYAQKTGVNGMNGGYLGVALDEYGNFSAASEGRVGGYNGTTNAVTESIGVRGPGQGTSGYAYLGGSGTLAQPLDSVARPTQTNTVQILLSATNQLTVTLQQGGTSPQTVMQMDLSGYARPDTLKFGFASGTGAATNNHDIRNLNITTLAANLWANGTGNGIWDAAGASTNTTNWNPAVNPTTGADILFDNTNVSGNQNITVNANQTVRSLSFDAPFNYTLSGNTITFANQGVPGFSGIAVSQTRGTGIETINSNLALSNAINIRNNSTGTLNINGTIATNGNTITLDGTGTNTNLAGVISGTGAIIKNDSGTDTLSAANTYSGGTTINAGTLNANNSTALGSGGVTLAGGTLGSTNSSTIANAVALTGNAGVSNITTSGTLTQTGGSFTLNMANATQSGAVNLSNNATARTLTVQVDSGTSTMSGAIANGGTATSGNLTKTGSGTLVLSGANTYTGTTTVTAGTVQLGASNRLADTSSVNIGAAGTLNLNGFSEKIGNLTAAGGATLDFGTPTGANTFVFGTYTAPASGVLVVNNWQNGADTLATTVASQNVSSVYLSGYGVAQEATTTTSTLYGNAYLLTPAAQTWKYWNGANTTWANNTGNWSSTASPTATTTTNPNATGALANIGNFNSASNPTLGGNVTLGGLRFDAAANRAYTLDENTRTLTMSQTTGPAFIQQQSAYTQTISGGTLALSSNTVADITGSGNLAISSAITGTANLIKDGAGSGKLILSGNSTGFSGGVFVNSGILQAAGTNALGTGAVTVSDGAGLELSGGVSPANAISVLGTGVGGTGAIRNVNGTNTLSGTITETGATTIAADTGTTLNLTGNLTGTNTNTTFTAAGTGAINVNRITTGTGGVTVNGGTVTLQGGTTANTYTGATTINSGTLILNKTAGTTAISTGGLVINNSGTVQLSAGNQIADNASVTINNSGTFNLNGQTETIGRLSSTSATATVALGAGSLSISSPNNAISSFAGAITGTAASSLNLGGTGTLYLSGNNSGYAGTTNVSNGTLNISGTNTVLGTGAANITGSGNLQIQGGLNVANNISINSTGTSGNGAIENNSGNNTFSGTVTVAGTSRINSDAGTLTLSNAVNLGTSALTVGGSGNVSITGAIAGGGTLTKDGAGTLRLSSATGNPSFTGATIISAGTIVAEASNVFSNTAAVTIASAGTLRLGAISDTIGSLNSTGTLDFGTGNGTLTLASGNSSLAGSLTGTGTIIIGPGATLTLGTNFNNPNINIVLNGGTLALNGTTDTFRNLTVTAPSVIDFAATGNSTLNVNGTLGLGTNALSITNWQNAADYFFAQNFTGATADVRGVPAQNQITFAPSYSSNATVWQSFDHQITPVPEPSTYGAGLMSLTLAGFALRRLRSRKSVR